MKVLVTGFCGMIGRVLIDELESAGHELRLLDRSAPEQATVFMPGCPERAEAPMKVNWPSIKAEITDSKAIRQAVEGMDAVIHLAAAVSGLPALGIETFRINALGTYVVLDACRLAGVKRFLSASSINAFGTFCWRLSGERPVYEKMPLDETFKVVPEDSYSLSKYVGEETCAAFTRAFGITTAAFRFAGVWTDDMYQAARKDGLEPTTAWSDDLYQWVHVLDISRGVRRALECPTLPAFGVYTLGAADTRQPEPTMEILTKFRPDLAARLERPLVGREPLLSIRKAAQTFGYCPKYRFDGVTTKSFERSKDQVPV